MRVARRGPPTRAARGRAAARRLRARPRRPPEPRHHRAPLAGGVARRPTGAITTGELVQAMALFGILAFPFRIVGFLLEELPRAVVANDRIAGVLAAPVRLEPDGPAGASGRTPRRGPRRRRLRLRRGRSVLDGVTARVAPGEVVALVGSTGAGKTTLCSLLVHLIDPDARRGPPGRRAARRRSIPTSLHRAAALVFQESFLFADTVRENLAMGDDGRPTTELWAALEIARARTFVERLPHGLDEVIGERGVTLSGGQRQRIALARALLRRPRLLLLDDATSAVDATVERAILDGLRDVRRRHHPRRRPPRVDHRARRPGAPARRRSHRRGRHPPRAARRARLRRPRPRLRGGRRVSLDESVDDELDAVVDVLTDAAPPGSHDHERRHPDETDEEEALRDAGAIAVLRRGLAVTPELQAGPRPHRGAGGGHRRRQARHPDPDPADPRPRRARRRRLPARVRGRGVPAASPRCSPSASTSSAGPPSSASCGPRRPACSACGCAPSSTSTACRWPTTSTSAAARSCPASRATSRRWRSSPSGAPSRGSSTRVLIVGTVGVMLVYSWQLALVSVAVFLPLAARPALPAAAPAGGLRRGPHGGRRHPVRGVRARDRRARGAGVRAAATHPRTPRRRHPHAVPGADGRGQVVRRDVPARRPLRRPVPGHRHGGRRHPRTRRGASASASWSRSSSS